MKMSNINIEPCNYSTGINYSILRKKGLICIPQILRQKAWGFVSLVRNCYYKVFDIIALDACMSGLCCWAFAAGTTEMTGFTFKIDANERLIAIRKKRTV